MGRTEGSVKKGPESINSGSSALSRQNYSHPAKGNFLQYFRAAGKPDFFLLRLGAAFGFTVLEILVALGVFLIVMGMVMNVLINSLRSVERGEKVLSKEQRQRICYRNISQEASSITKMAPPGFSFAGNQSGFQFIYAQEDKLIEASYTYNVAASALEHSYQESPDYDAATFDKKEVCLSDIAECSFSYSDGTNWKSQWSSDAAQPPRAVKITFKFRDDTRERQLLVNIPVAS